MFRILLMLTATWNSLQFLPLWPECVRPVDIRLYLRSLAGVIAFPFRPHVCSLNDISWLNTFGSSIYFEEHAKAVIIYSCVHKRQHCYSLCCPVTENTSDSLTEALTLQCIRANCGSQHSLRGRPQPWGHFSFSIPISNLAWAGWCSGWDELL